MRLQYGTCNCRIWAIWMHERWVQCRRIYRQALKLCSVNQYRAYQLQPASGTTVMIKCRQPLRRNRDRHAYDIAAKRMASRELTKRYIERTLQEEGVCHRAAELQHFQSPWTASLMCGVRATLHRTHDMSHKPKPAEKLAQKKSARHVSTTSQTTARKQTASALLLTSWLQDTTGTSKPVMQTINKHI